MKEEIANIREEIERKFTENNGELQTQKRHMTEAQARVAELEEWQSESKETMIEMSNQTHQIQEKMVDLEGRSRRNNIQIFGVPEETEGESVTKYVEQLLSTELELQEVVQKRKSYLGIKKVLKDKGIRFQTPLAKIRIYWEAGVKTYDDAIDAARDMRERGLEMEVPGGAAAPVEERRAQPVWQRVRGQEGRHDSARQAREMLQKWKA
ncbi:LINE-1 type transposase domain containing protein 1 [Dissostichus eleginoides]|uniref:LINE-1 type transposase domain containing protein 1 n=1 Tax=Dissostichus eleginoides TaxID=100907 RepID=A0AAD9F5P4_DISEL|nr:LINE-1 type transposase domain containing protein 1 [Dissostichus eleginoides]